MLDDCKGERLEEVLAIFSSAVLKKAVAEQEALGYPAIARQLALGNLGYSTPESSPAQEQMNGLIMAHRASLSRLLRQRAQVKSRLMDLTEVLEVKRREMARRRQAVLLRRDQFEERQRKERAGSILCAVALGVHGELAGDVWQTLRSNWSGNETWMHVVLEKPGQEATTNPLTCRQDPMLVTPFDRVWRRVHAGRLAELEGGSNKTGGPLLNQLRTQVAMQKSRLGRWQTLREQLLNTGSESHNMPVENASPRDRKVGAKGDGGDLGFSAHEGLRVSQISPRKRAVGTAPLRHVVSDEYAELVTELETELETAWHGSIPFSLAELKQIRPLMNTRTLGPITAAPSMLSVEVMTDEPISELSEVEEQIALLPMDRRAGAETKAQVKEEAPARPGSQAESVALSARRLGGPTPESPGESKGSREAEELQPLEPSTSLIESAPRILPSEKLVSRSSPDNGAADDEKAAHTSSNRVRERKATPPESPPRRTSESSEEDLAKRILASVAATSPTPAKKKPRHTLSLAERTRLTMARTSSWRTTGLFVEDDDEDDDVEEDGGGRRRPDRGDGDAGRPLSATSSRQHSEGMEPTLPMSTEGNDSLKGNADGNYEDLVARTRKSMAGFEAARKKAQLERRRSQRKSKYQASRREESGQFNSVWAVEEEGKNDGDTPSMKVLAEELMQDGGGDDNYEAVFRSRPKIKTSPVPSPKR